MKRKTLIERLREKDREGYSELFGLAADALEAAASRERELEARVAELKRGLHDHGITVKPDGTYEYEDNSALSEQPCEWSKTVQDAKRYRWLRTRIYWRDENHQEAGLEWRQRVWRHIDYRTNPPSSEHIDEYIDG